MRPGLLKLSITLTVTLFLAAVIRIGLWAVPYDLESSRESVRLRNSLIASTMLPGAVDWTPARPPAGFQVETGPVPEQIAKAWRAIEKTLPANASDFERALAISVHMRSNGKRGGRPIVSNTLEAYRQIVQTGEGFCSDYTQVFNALAIAAGLPVREWGLAFDGYGGAGHAVSEYYDRSLGKWVFIDSYGSVYVRRVATGEVLSAMEYRDYLLSYDNLDAARREIELVPIVADRLEFGTLAKTFAYQKRGAEQFFLIWGNNVFSYDADPVIQAAGRISRSVEQITGMALGLLPEIRLISEPRTQSAIEALFALRNRFLLYILAAALLLVLTAFQVRAYVLRVKRQQNLVLAELGHPSLPT